MPADVIYVHVRITGLGVPTVGDRVAQTVAAMALEPRAESIFHDDSYGYRRKRGALDAVSTCRERCWRKDWVIDLDIRKFFDSVPWDLVVKAVEANVRHEQRWITLYVKRWLAAPIAMPDGKVAERDKGTPQGSAITHTVHTLTHVPPCRLCRGGRAAGRWFADRDAVADGDLLRADKDVFDQQVQDPPASSVLAAAALPRSWVRKPSRPSASLR